MARFLDRLGRTAARHKWITIGIWVLVAVVVGGWAQSAGGKTTDVYTIPGAQSQKAQDLLEERFPAQAGGDRDRGRHSLLDTHSLRPTDASATGRRG